MQSVPSCHLWGMCNAWNLLMGYLDLNKMDTLPNKMPSEEAFFLP